MRLAGQRRRLPFFAWFASPTRQQARGGGGFEERGLCFLSAGISPSLFSRPSSAVGELRVGLCEL